MLTERDVKTEAPALAAANGISIELASDYLWLIGDTPELDELGRLVVSDRDGVELARLTLPE